MRTKTASDGLEDYLKDASNIERGNADRLYVPESEEELASLIREANARTERITVCGARTGTVGGAVPFGGSVVSMERLDRLEPVNEEDSTVWAGAGVILADLQRSVESAGFYYPPDPTEWSCQIGGTIATNASGSRSFRYGSTRDFVNRMKVVLASGELIDIRRGDFVSKDGVLRIKTPGGEKIKAKIPTYRKPDVRKNTCGYFTSDAVDAVDLFIGSEGTLGVVAGAELRLVPKPPGSLSGIVFFRDESDLLDAAREIRERSFETRGSKEGSGAGLNASLIEYFDARSIEFIREKFPDAPEGMSGALFFEQETDESNEDALFDEWNSLLEGHNGEMELSWFAVSENDLERMREFRHALPVAVNERVVRNGQLKVSTDMAIPDANFPLFLRYAKEKLDAGGIEYVIFGHIGDCHLHINMLPRDEEEATRAKHLYGRFVAQTIMLGGTVSAEHGIGKLKSRYLYVMYGERYINEMAELKRAFDPNLILGMGNMFGEKFLESNE